MNETHVNETHVNEKAGNKSQSSVNSSNIFLISLDLSNANSKLPQISFSEEAFSRHLIPFFVAVIVIFLRYNVLSCIEYLPPDEISWTKRVLCPTDQFLLFIPPNVQSKSTRRSQLSIHTSTISAKVAISFLLELRDLNMASLYSFKSWTSLHRNLGQRPYVFLSITRRGLGLRLDYTYQEYSILYPSSMLLNSLITPESLKESLIVLLILF